MRPLNKVLMILTLAAAAGCSKSASPTAAGPVLACQTDGTGLAVFENGSVTNTSYDVFWDGATLTTLLAGQTSRTYLFTAGPHTLTFRVANSTTVACAMGTVTLAVCANTAAYSCAT